MAQKTAQQLIETYLNEITRKHDPKAKIVFKSQSKLMKVLDKTFMFFNKTFMTNFITVVGATIYVPDDFYSSSPVHLLSIIAHETIHIQQKKKLTFPLFMFLYLSPQILALLAFGALIAICGSNVWLWSLAALLFAAPLPAIFRYKLELEAYRITRLFQVYAYNSPPEHIEIAKEEIIKNLSGVNYYFCWPFKNKIKKDLEDLTFLTRLPKKYQEVVSFLEKHQLVKATPLPPIKESS